MYICRPLPSKARRLTPVATYNLPSHSIHVTSPVIVTYRPSSTCELTPRAALCNFGLFRVIIHQSPFIFFTQSTSYDGLYKADNPKLFHVNVKSPIKLAMDKMPQMSFIVWMAGKLPSMFHLSEIQILPMPMPYIWDVSRIKTIKAPNRRHVPDKRPPNHPLHDAQKYGFWGRCPVTWVG